MMEISSTNTSRSNFVQALALAQIAEAMLTNRLLEIEPRLQEVLNDGRAMPGHRLLRAIRRAVMTLDHLGEFASVLGDLKANAANNGAGSSDFNRLGAVFISRIERSFATTAASETRARWKTVFRLLAETQRAFTTAR